MHVARLEASDAARYRALMLHAYEAAADAFTSTPEERAAQPDSWWVKRLADADSVAFGAFFGDELAGTVTLEFATRSKTSRWRSRRPAASSPRCTCGFRCAAPHENAYSLATVPCAFAVRAWRSRSTCSS